MSRMTICLALFLFMPTLYAEDSYLTGQVLKEDCLTAKQLMSLDENKRKEAPIEDIIRTRECFEFLQGIHGGISYANFAIVMHNPKLTSEQLAERSGVCLPPLSNKEMIDALEDFFKKHADKLDMPRELVAGHALRLAYPRQKYCNDEYYDSLRN